MKLYFGYTILSAKASWIIETEPERGYKELFLLMPVLSQAFFTLVCCHLMSFSFLPAGHLKLFL
jgi:hypothetical protein